MAVRAVGGGVSRVQNTASCQTRCCVDLKMKRARAAVLKLYPVGSVERRMAIAVLDAMRADEVESDDFVKLVTAGFAVACLIPAFGLPALVVGEQLFGKETLDGVMEIIQALFPFGLLAVSVTMGWWGIYKLVTRVISKKYKTPIVDQKVWEQVVKMYNAS